MRGPARTRTILGIVLSGSAARGIATEHSDVDVFVVLTDDAAEGRTTSRSPAIDEIPQTLADVEDVPPWGHEEYGYSWGYAYAQVLRDDTGGRITEAVRRQATHTVDEARRMLLDGDQLDGYINMAYRALKSDRDGRALERRLDAAESVHWWLDVVFTLEGRVRPYNKYLAWELREHPLSVPEWSAGQPAAAGRGGAGRRRGRGAGGVRRHRAREPRLGRAARRARPPRAHRELG